MSTKYPDSCRSLDPGEAIPTGAPSRLPTREGYIRLRWKVGVRQYVQVLEHRVFNGRVTTAEAVHHKNHNRSDNRPENLEPMSHAEHLSAHRRIDWDETIRLYQSGLTMTQVGELVGTHSAHVHKILKRSGVPARPAGARPLPLDRDDITRRLSAGESARSIAQSLGCGRYPIDQVRQSMFTNTGAVGVTSVTGT